MCFGGFDAPSAGEQETYNYEATLLGAPPLGDVPVSRSGYVGPVAITTTGFARGDDGSAQYQSGDKGFSLRGAVETVGFLASGGSASSLALAAGRGANVAHALTSGRGGGSGTGTIEAPETGGLPSLPQQGATPQLDKNYAAVAPTVAPADGVMRTLPWLDGSAPAPAPGAQVREAERAHLLGTDDAALAAHTADHDQRLQQVLRRASNPTGPMGLRIRPTTQQPRLLGE
ncbi:MAG: hypothetical protein HQ495_01100 [Alphaproteobacteria bacterium]|nr:hypothetical protein [Alphaproteobacteria bacterium]